MLKGSSRLIDPLGKGDQFRQGLACMFSITLFRGRSGSKKS